MIGKTHATQQNHAQPRITANGIQLPSSANPAFLTPGAPQTISGAYTTTVELSSDNLNLTITSTGSIHPDGNGGGRGAYGVYSSYDAAGAYVLNQGSITGGTGGGGPYGAYGGGIGVCLEEPGTLNNAGTISGGVCDSASFGGYGGIGVQLFSFSGDSMLFNSGAIFGGNGAYGTLEGGYGAPGLSASGTFSVTNTGLIEGGQVGGTQAGGHSVGYGGDGLALSGIFLGADNGTPTAMATNDGTILGGNVGATAKYGRGGRGVDVISANMTNTAAGLIQGGAGNATAAGGIGVYVFNGTLTNAGTISGGIGYNGTQYAVALCGREYNTLVIDPGAVFNGQVAVVNSDGHSERLDLGGTTAGSLTGLGTEFTGFPYVISDAASNWSLTGANTMAAATVLAVYGKLGVTGTLDNAGATAVSFGGALRAGGSGVVLLSTLALTGGSIATGPAGQVVIGASTAGTARGALTVASGYSVSGYGTIGGVVGNTTIIDDGTITASTASNGTLSLARAVSGTGTLAIDSGATLFAKMGLSVASVAFEGAATLALATPTAITAPISGFGTGDKIDLDYLRVKSVSFANDTLTLLGKAHAILGTLIFTGDDTAANFSLSPDGNHGTDLGFTATPALADFAPRPAPETTPAPMRHPDPGWHAETSFTVTSDWFPPHALGY